MRLVVTSDTHSVVAKGVIPDGDVFVHGGDLMSTGYPDDWHRQLEWLAELPHRHKYYIPGNHDFHLQVYPGPALQQLRSIGVVCLGLPGNANYETATLPNGMTVLGLPYVTGLPRWAFNADSDTIENALLPYWYRDTPDIIVSHAPPYWTLDRVGTKRTGIRVYYDYLLDNHQSPKYWFHGHIHEDYGHMRHNCGTEIYNVAMCDRNYTHANPPVVLDL